MAKKKTEKTENPSTPDPVAAGPQPEATPKAAKPRAKRAKADAPEAPAPQAEAPPAKAPAKPAAKAPKTAKSAPPAPAEPPARAPAPTPAPAPKDTPPKIITTGLVPMVPSDPSHCDASSPEFADGIALHEFHTLAACTCFNPHRLLGCHAGEFRGQKGLIVRAWHPDAERIDLVAKASGQAVPLRRLHVKGLFGAFFAGQDFPFDYQLRYKFSYREDVLQADPYHFLPTVGDLDLYLHGEGNHLHSYRKLGAHLMTMNGVPGVAFSLWAPAARRISVIGDWNNWDGRVHPMRSMGSSGVWEIFIPHIRAGAGYRFEILTHDNHLRYKADPYAFSYDLRPSTDCRVFDLAGGHQWRDGEYMAGIEGRRHLEEPMSVYEVHLGSWMRVPEEGNRWLTYRELADRLIPHVQRYHFTHVELLPVMEHPFDGSWGYQVTGYFAPSSRFGSPDDFKYLVDRMHQAGIGVILDWVPAHFPRDDWALRWFDGTALYEHEDPRRGEHKDWGTLIFNYGRPEVKNFLLANALFWLEEYHADGLRVDAVASMLYLDYSRQAGEWVPNQYGGRENLEAIAFLRQMNEVLHREFPGRFTVAEESTAFPGVSRPTYTGGLGFTFKWNMGWMNDTLRYFQRDPIFRKYHQGDLTFSMVYQYTENFVLPFSHDEVVHGKGSMLAKMPGDPWQKFANLRLLYSYMYAHPGKKLLFMGAEFGQSSEWKESQSLDWHLPGQSPMHAGVEHCLESLGRLYRDNRELWIFDHEPVGFRWIDFNDHQNSIISFVRQGPDGHILCIFNFTPMPRYGYRIGAPSLGTYREVYNSDAEAFGGGNVGNYGEVWSQAVPMHGCKNSIHVNVPPLGAVFLKFEGL